MTEIDKRAKGENVVVALGERNQKSSMGWHKIVENRICQYINCSMGVVKGVMEEEAEAHNGQNQNRNQKLSSF